MQRDKRLSKREAGQKAVKRDDFGVSGTSDEPNSNLKQKSRKLGCS